SEGARCSPARIGVGRTGNRRTGTGARRPSWAPEQYDARFRSNTHARLILCEVRPLGPCPSCGRGVLRDPRSTMPVARIGVSLEGPLLKAFDRLVRDGGSRSRSEALRNLIPIPLAHRKA